MTDEIFVALAAFKVNKEKSVMYRKYKTPEGLARGVKMAFLAFDADYVSLRKIKDE